MLLPYNSRNPLLTDQKTSQNAEDVERLVKQIEYLKQVLENSRKGDRVSAGILSKIDRLSTYDTPLPRCRDGVAQQALVQGLE
jgi:hypothetical protein